MYEPSLYWAPAGVVGVAPSVEPVSVVVGVADSAAMRVVFGGVVQGVLDCGDSRQRLDSGITRIFDDYPADQTGM